MQKIIPTALKKGDTICVVAPSKGLKIIGSDTRKLAEERFGEMGLNVTFGKNTTDENWDLFGSSAIAQRVEDLMEAFADSRVKGIFTIIGGFNSNQMLPFLDYELIKKNPKILCGFSDITALINGIYAKTGLVTFCGPHYSSFGMQKGFDYTWKHMKDMLLGEGACMAEPSEKWSDDAWFINQEKREFAKNEGFWVIHSGEARGAIVGGNLGSFILLNGTAYRPEFKPDTILFAENCFSSQGDGAEFLRQLQAVAYQPDFANVKGLVIGRFQKASEMTREKLEYIIESIPQLKNIPVIANVDFGHTTPMLTLPIGGYCEISSAGLTVRI